MEVLSWHAAGPVLTESSASVSGSQGKEGLQQEAEEGGAEWGHTQLFLSKAGTAGSCWTRARRGGAAADRSVGLLTAGGGAPGIQRALPRRSRE